MLYAYMHDACIGKGPTLSSHHLPLTATDFHILLVLARDDLYGYAIQKAVETESGGTVSPEIGSLYRALARLVTAGFVEEVPPPQQAAAPSPGRPRRYYHLTQPGREALGADARRLEEAVEIARERQILGSA